MMRSLGYFKLIFSFLLSTSILSSVRADPPKYLFPHLSRVGYGQIETLYKNINHHCSFPECLKIYIGRSSIFLSAYSASREPEKSHILLPLSGLRTARTEEELDIISENFGALVLKPLLLPLIESSTLKRVAVIDFVSEGTTLATASRIIKYWISKNSERNFDVLSIGYGSTVKTAAHASLIDAKIALKVMPFPLYRDLAGDLATINHLQIADEYAPFDSWSPLTAKAPPVIDFNRRRKVTSLSVGSPAVTYPSYNKLIEWFKNPSLVDSCKTPFDPRFL